MHDISSFPTVHNYYGSRLRRALSRKSPAQRAHMAPAAQVQLYDPTWRQLSVIFEVSTATLRRVRNPAGPTLTDAALDRLVAQVGAERMAAALDRAAGAMNIMMFAATNTVANDGGER